MENNERVDDQNSGWFQVKKKHRNTKFSLQSWVGGFSGKNASNSTPTQHSIIKNDGNSHGKQRSQSPRGEENFVLNPGNVTYSSSVLNVEEEGKCNLNTSAVKHDTEDQTSPPLLNADSLSELADSGTTTQIRTPDTTVHKIRWGDLDDGDLSISHENSIGAGIKFGSIGDDNLVTSRRDENIPDVVQCDSSSSNVQEKRSIAMAVNVAIVSHQTPALTDKDALSGDSIKEVRDISLEVEDAGIVVNEAPALVPVVSDVSVSEVFHPNCSSNMVVISEVTESCVPESGSKNVGAPAASVGDVKGLQDGNVDDVISNSHNMNVLEESDSNESKERFRQRLWCFLFENLNRSVDELYLLCELECDLDQMKEAILVLEEAASDFKELINRVKEFEEVKKSSQTIDEAPVILKSDHRRPHALSWEVRRMTTSPHRADILSSSLEAFRKIQQERSSLQVGNNAQNAKSGCPIPESCGNLKTSSRVSDGAHHVRDSVTKARKPIGSSDPNQKNSNEEKNNVETGKPSKAILMQNGRNAPDSLLYPEVNISNLPAREDSAAMATIKSKREQLGSVADKMLSKKDKVPTEGIIEKNPKSIDSIRRQIPLPERDKERRTISAGKSLDAWKEKRNWADILSSPFRVSSRMSYSPGMSRRSAERVRTLHDKLMSPDKRKKTASDLKREAEEKHARALKIRSELESERVQKLQRTSEKLNRVNEWQAVRNMKLREGMYARHQRSESRHEAFLAQVAKRAGDESSKVNEVRFITSLNEENKKLMLRQKLHESELRRAEKLQVIKTKQKEDLAREEAVLGRRKLIEAEKLQRLAEIQRKKEEAQVRREEERKASSAAREARAIEQLRRKEERAKAQQEEAELLAQKLAERLSESEQRRKIYLEQIRERASMDFRDQSSPLLRRQGRSTPTNGSDDSQASIASGIGGSSLGIGNMALQHSMKRRIKKIRQRLMALKYEFPEPPVGGESAGIGYRVAVGAARAKVGRWLQELQRLRQARKEGVASIGLIIAEMIKYLEGKDPELQASRQAGLLDFIASALPASQTSKPEACQFTLHLLKLLRVVLSTPANRGYFLAQNLLPPIVPMLSAALENYIKMAASLNVSGNSGLPSNKTSTENFESISEILNNFLWTVTIIFGHISSEERQLKMRDGLLELLISYQVIHRLRDLFALHDRPQMEGSAYPDSILLSIQLLMVLTSRPENMSSIDWESSPVQMKQKIDSEVIRFADSAHSVINNSCGDCRPPLSAINSSSVMHLPDVPEDRPLDEVCNINRSEESLTVCKDPELVQTDSSVNLKNSDVDKVEVLDELGKKLNGDTSDSSVPQKDEKHAGVIVPVHKHEKISVLDQPVVFLLSAISETGLVSLPSLLTAVLLQANNRTSSEQASFILPSNFEEVATGVLKVLNNVALLDLVFLQQMLARPDLKMEFFHLISFLLSHCSSKWKAPNDQVGLLMLEALSLLGHFSLFHSGNQAVLRWGKSPTILHKVCDLPFVFFSDPELMPVLAGTLVAACYGCEQNKFVVQQELSVDMQLSLLRSCRNAASASQPSSTFDNAPTDESGEHNQLGPDFRRPQMDIRRSNGKSTRVSSGKNVLGNSMKISKMRNQRDGKATRNFEEVAAKHNLTFSKASALMLHCRFPNSFIDKVEQFFSAEISNGAEGA